MFDQEAEPDVWSHQQVKEEKHPVNISEASRRSGSSDEPVAGASAPSKQDLGDQAPAQQEPAEEPRGAKGPVSEEEDIIWTVGSPAGSSATPVAFNPTVPLLQRLILSPAPSYWRDNQGLPPPPPPASSASDWLTPPLSGLPPLWSQALAGPHPLPTVPPPPHQATPPPHGPPFLPPQSQAAQVEMLAIMRQQLECLQGIQASISANHIEVMSSLARRNREARRYHLMTESYLAGLLRTGVDQSALVLSPTSEASPVHPQPGHSSSSPMPPPAPLHVPLPPGGMPPPAPPPPPGRRRPATGDLGPYARRRRM
ncbi:uncharacterized protein O3C94_016893 [Discoglossus pictus]